MSEIFSYSGDASLYVGPMYPNPKEADLFLSLGHHVDVFFPPRKRSRVTAPYVFSGEVFEKQPASIDVLPDECLFEVLRHVGDEERSTCASVSKRWLMLLSNITRDEVCAKRAEIENQESESDGCLSRCLEGKKATDVRLAAIAVGTSYRGGLGKLTIRGSKSTHGITKLGFRSIARSCPSLRHLSLWDVSSIGDEALYEIANGCKLLENLDFSRCPLISDKGLLSIAKNCPLLTSVTIEYCSNIGNESLKALGSYCPNLKSVSIKNCPLVGDQGIASLLSSAGESVTKLKIHGLNISDVSLAVIGHYGNAITDLSFIGLQNVGERGFWVMGNGGGLQKLRSFTVASCIGVTDKGLEAVARGSPNLKQCCLQKCMFLSDNGLVSFAKAADSLESLLLEECHRITQYGIFSLLSNCGKALKALTLSKCLGFKDMVVPLPSMEFSTTLRSLSIRNCLGFGNNSLALLGKMCPKLQYLELQDLHGVTDEGLLPLIQHSEAGLSKVSLKGCVNLTDKVIEVISKLHGLTLEQLNLDGCKFVSDASLVNIAENCSLLSELDVSKCTVSDVGIAALSCSSQLKLQILSMSGCCFVSRKSLPSLLQLGQTLVGLNIQHCKAISSNMVDVLVERLWRCDILS